MVRSRTLAAAFVLLAAGCASAGLPNDDNRITVVVSNEYHSTVSAYAVWDNSNRIRLGDVSSGRTREFSTPRRGSRIALGMEIMATPPPGTSAGPSAFQGGRAPDPSSPFLTSEAIDVSVGEGIEWQLTGTGSLLFRRLSEQGPGAFVGQP